MDLRDSLCALLGPDWDQAPFDLAQPVRGTGMQRLSFVTGDGTRIPALYLPSRTGAAVLYCHAHGGRYDIGTAELSEGRPALLRPYLPEFVARGWGVLCLEMPCFGSRSDVTESALAKARLWEGRTLFGQMLGEQRAARAWLAAQPQVDATRIAVMGISMGGTLAWWQAALDPGFAAAVSIACFADLATLVASGGHDRHGLYMTVPGLLPLARSGQISGLAAPTPLLHCVGLRDWSTPEPAFRQAEADLRAAYHKAGADTALRFVTDPACGHAETAQMRDAVLQTLDAALC